MLLFSAKYLSVYENSPLGKKVTGKLFLIIFIISLSIFTEQCIEIASVHPHWLNASSRVKEF